MTVCCCVPCRVVTCHGPPVGKELSPPDSNLLVQQGGTLVFKGTDVVWRWNDSGILKYTDISKLLAAAEAAVVQPTQQQAATAAVSAAAAAGVASGSRPTTM